MRNYTNQTQPSKDCWLTETEVSNLIGVTRATLQKWRWRRVGLPYSKFMRSVRYKESDLYAYMESGRIEPETSNTH
jgi:hypothetical protein